MLKSLSLVLGIACLNPASAEVFNCNFDQRCSSLTAECGDEPLRIRADLENGSLTILDNGNTFDAQVVNDQVMPFRSLAVVAGRGAISMLSVHEDLSAVYTYHTGLLQVGAIWSSASGTCKETS